MTDDKYDEKENSKKKRVQKKRSKKSQNCWFLQYWTHSACIQKTLIKLKHNYYL